MSNGKENRIKIAENGPYQVSGTKLLKLRPNLNSAGRPVKWERGQEFDRDESYELCRCGASSNKPFCDWTHVSIDFDGKETADRAPTATRRKSYEGQGIVMTDDKTLCIHAGFCVTEKTEVWELVEQASDPAARAELINMIRNCPAGRLEYAESPQGLPVEEKLPQEIGVIEDGPIYVRGGIVVEGSNGESYEIRNRMTLCRCGASMNKPFCDGRHAEIGFRDKK